MKVRTGVSGASIGVVGILCSASLGTSQAWALNQEPLLRIGEVQGAPEYLLDRVSGAIRLSGGEVVVGNGVELRFYDANGAYLRTVGRSGDGPGEFRSLSLSLGGGDTVRAWDPVRFRLTLYSRIGELLESRQFERPPPVEGFGLESTTLLADGSLLLRLLGQRPPGDPTSWGLYRPAIRFARYDPAARSVVLIGPSYGGLSQQVFSERGQILPIVQPFTPYVQHAYGDDRLYISNGEEFVIDAYDHVGRRVSRFTSDLRRPFAVTRRQLDQAFEDELRNYSGSDSRLAAFRSAWNGIEKPALHPMFGLFIVDELGLLWARVIDPSRTESVFVILGGNGAELGSVTLPAGFLPTEIGRDYVLGRMTDRLGVQMIYLYRLQRPTADNWTGWVFDSDPTM